jgi:hypothetical protein
MLPRLLYGYAPCKRAAIGSGTYLMERKRGRGKYMDTEEGTLQLPQSMPSL